MEIVQECTHCGDIKAARTFADARAFAREHRACGSNEATIPGDWA